MFNQPRKFYMNFRQLLLCSMLFFTLPLAAENIRLLQQSAINKKIKEIKKQIIHDERILIGVKTLSHVQNIYIFYSLISPWIYGNKPEQPSGPLCDACKKLAEKH